MTSTALLMVLARRLMRLVGCGVTLQALAAQMAGSQRGFLTILGHTKLVLDRGRVGLLGLMLACDCDTCIQLNKLSICYYKTREHNVLIEYMTTWGCQSISILS